MLNPNSFYKRNNKPSANSLTPSFLGNGLALEQLAGQMFNLTMPFRLKRTRWDAPIQVPQVLYQKLKVQPPCNKVTGTAKKQYPPSLIQYISRAYSRCKTPEQKKLMQVQIRDTISKCDINDVNWLNFRLPDVADHLPGGRSTSFSSSPYPYPQNQVQPQTQFSSSMMSYSPINSVDPRRIQNEGVPSSMSFGPHGGRVGFQTSQNISCANGGRSIIDKLVEANSNSYSFRDNTKLGLEETLKRFSEKIQNRNAQTQKAMADENQEKKPVKEFVGFQDSKDVELERIRERYARIAAHEKEARERKNLRQKEMSKKQTNNYRNQPQEPKQKLHSDYNLQVVESTEPQKNILTKNKKNIQKAVQSNRQRASKITKKDAQAIISAADNNEQLNTVAKRFVQFNKFQSTSSKKAHVSNIEEMDDDLEDFDFKIVGKCKKIDKPFLRITHRPDPQTVRPETILRKAYNHYKKQYKNGGAYDTIIWQFRSIRQDLTVQDIRNSFTVEVYEQNLKMSLFQDDLLQLKQCQTNLWELYREGLYNKKSDRGKFISYHFISMILQERYKELEYMLTLLPSDAFEADQIQSSLKLKRYLVIGNYKAIFDFYTQNDQTVKKLMNQYIDKVRVKCLVMVCKTFGDKMTFLQLSENTGEDQDILELLVKEQGGVIVGNYFMLKESLEPLRNSQHLQVKKVTNLMN